MRAAPAASEERTGRCVRAKKQLFCALNYLQNRALFFGKDAKQSVVFTSLVVVAERVQLAAWLRPLRVAVQSTVLDYMLR